MLQLDPTAFFNTAELAITARLNGVDVVGVFNFSPSNALELVDGIAPTFTLPTADVDADPRDQQLVIAAGEHVAIPAGATYTVRNFQPDAAGITTLTLSS